MTTEEMLKAILEAQGRPEYAQEIRGDPEDPHVLEILLDPAGLKAAYGLMFPDDYAEIDFEGSCGCNCHKSEPFWSYVGMMIMRTWLSKPEGDAEGAIKTAYSLLPQS